MREEHEISAGVSWLFPRHTYSVFQQNPNIIKVFLAPINDAKLKVNTKEF